MREIIFRGKRVDNGEWVEGVPTWDESDAIPKLLMVSNVEKWPFGNAYVDPETVGQFIGIHDKDGKKIFEGDIVGFTAENELWEPQYYEGTVYFCDGTFWVDCGKDGDDNDVLFTIGHAKLCDESLQIIGKIHDNPELLT
jgi:uncharacterized phage protein (TIGR01671 family)